MSQKLMGRKCGMTQRFDEKGKSVACTVIAVEPNVVTQINASEKLSYTSIQTAADKIESKDPRRTVRIVGKPGAGHFKKAGVDARRFVTESRVASVEGVEVGQELGVDLFKEGDLIDVMGTSKGKGFQGVMKLHGFKGGPAAHGSGFHRHAGSTGMRSTPGICFKGGKRASQMGNRRKTVQNLKVLTVDAEKGLLIVAGAIPGHTGARVTIQSAVKKGN